MVNRNNTKVYFLIKSLNGFYNNRIEFCVDSQDVY